MIKRYFYTVLLFLAAMLFFESTAGAFWIFTPKDKKFVNPKHAVKDTPEEQFEWAMRFYESGDFKRASDEFTRLTESYSASDVAPEAQYYAARSYEEQGRYWFAYQNYKKTIDNYPYTRRLDEIIERLYNLAGTVESAETAKIMGIELSESMDRAAEMYKTIVNASPFSPYADKSLYRLGDVNRRIRKYEDAMQAYSRILSDYPDSPLVPEARYQLAFTKYEASLDPEYDQESTDQALKDFKEIAATTPIPAVAGEAEKVLSELRERKADSTIKIAEFYEKQGRYASAIMYYDSVRGKFEGTSAAEYAEERIKHLEGRMKK
ncbi:MAG: outer membrane protein assembly factor BamD [Candidatus Omnitrophota bacterium]